MDVGITLQNKTNGQPITPPVVIVHDPNVNPISYTRPSELEGIDDLSEGGFNGDLNPAIHAWRADTTEELTVSGAFDEDQIGRVATVLPRTGGTAPSSTWILLFGIAGSLIVFTGARMALVARRRR